jgi:hypothetical protein
MAETLLMHSDVEVVLTTGTVIKVRCASIEERDIIACLCESLEKCGAKVAEYNIIRSDDVTDKFRRQFREVQA